MALLGNGPVTVGFQPKNGFFGPSSVLTPLNALETPTNFWKHMSICKSLAQNQKSTKFEPFGEFLGLGLTLAKAINEVKNQIFACLSFSIHSMASVPFSYKLV